MIMNSTPCIKYLLPSLQIHVQHEPEIYMFNAGIQSMILTAFLLRFVQFRFNPVQALQSPIVVPGSDVAAV